MVQRDGLTFSLLNGGVWSSAVEGYVSRVRICLLCEGHVILIIVEVKNFRRFGCTGGVNLLAEEQT